MKIILITFVLLINIALSQPKTNSFLTYREYSNYMMASPGAFKFGLYGFANPASTNFLHDADFTIGMNANDLSFDNYNKLITSFAGPGYGFGAIYNSQGDTTIYDYKYSIAFGDKSLGFGISYGFVGGRKGALGRSNSISFGTIYRPINYLSFGAVYTTAVEDWSDSQEMILEAGVRPFGNELITLFADYSTIDLEKFEPDFDYWSAGAVVEPIDGIRVSARYFKDKRVNIGVDLSLGTYGVSYVNNGAADEGGLKSNTVFYRSGAKDRSIMEGIDYSPIKYYAKLDLTGSIKYQNFKYFDSGKTLLELLDVLESVKENKAIKGLIINANQFSVNLSMKWEIREKLKELKFSGKKIIIFIERAGMADYHFASVADHIIMDEMGSLSLEGYISGRSFYKNMLEKLDIGFEEIRLFKYKSAAEDFARTDFSEGAKEQNLALINSWFATTKLEIAKERKSISEEKFEDLVNKKIFYLASEAKNENLIDAYGRWHDIEDVVKEIDKDYNFIVNANNDYNKPEPYDNKWGQNSSSIALIYVNGVCAMDDGIKARKLVNYVKSAAKNNSIKAIILRVDSPGGDALASEYIAEIVRENKGKKPIIVSQGMVAASGGYWLSMDADKILSSPYTITGSIGVIGSWIYDKGAGGDLGITTDKVQIGKYADLGFGWRLPLIGLGLPLRNLNADERSQWDASISTMYGEFVKKVATGRKMDSIDVHNVAQGRIWSGRDGIEKKLVDELGGLDYAIKLAKKEADLSEDVSILEYPEQESFDINMLLNQVVGVETKTISKDIEAFKFMVENNGRPMPMAPLEILEYYYNIK